ncbi:MAG: metallophosphoesterase [Clostridia bacterium]|nr:metallophosphoesterase [Clostridia bacterium]
MPKVYAIADLHMSHSVPDKAMDVFGAHWANHTERLAAAWNDTVREDDLVLIPGDISWAMYLRDAEADLAFLGELPGTKLLLRGNHDFWWSSVTQVRNALPKSVFALQNDVFRFRNLEIAGTRGWTIPESTGFKESEDRKLYERELIRLGLSLNGLTEDAVHIVMLHFPPFSEAGTPSAFVQLLEPYRVAAVVYGHLHGGKAHASAFTGDYHGTAYHLVAADALHFVPKEILTID